MKKGLSIIIFIFIIAILSSNRIYAEYNKYLKFNNEEIKIETISGDTYYLETQDLKKYRINKNDNLYLNIDILDDKGLFYIKMFESSSYIYLYGSYVLNEDATAPFIIRMIKDMSYYDYYIGEENVNYNQIESLIEYSSDLIVATIMYNATFNFYYKGYYKLVSFNDNLEIIKSLEIGENNSKVSIYYDLIKVTDSYNRETFYDREFNKKEKLNEEIKYGYFELDKSLYVNDLYYEIGTTFNTPGLYILKDSDYTEELIINLKCEIEFSGYNKSNLYYGSVSYIASGGEIYINGNISQLNGKIDNIGVNTIIIKGLDDYIESYKIIINPLILSEINENMEIGDSISFNGVAYLNDELIESGYTIKNSGDYTLKIYLDDIEIESYKFSVNNNIDDSDKELKEESDLDVLKILYIMLSILGLILIFLIAKRIIKYIKLKKLKYKE